MLVAGVAAAAAVVVAEGAPNTLVVGAPPNTDADGWPKSDDAAAGWAATEAPPKMLDAWLLANDGALPKTLEPAAEVAPNELLPNILLFDAIGCAAAFADANIPPLDAAVLATVLNADDWAPNGWLDASPPNTDEVPPPAADAAEEPKTEFPPPKKLEAGVGSAAPNTDVWPPLDDELLLLPKILLPPPPAAPNGLLGLAANAFDAAVG